MILNSNKNNYDVSWKDAIEEFFEDFLIFFAPDLYQKVDLDQGFEFEDKEFNRLFPKSQSKDGPVDKLIKVKLKNGNDKLILVHVEVQGYYEKDFTRRLFRYFYRIYDKYQKNIFTLVIFTDPNKSFKPNQYRYKFLDTELSYKYRTYKILEQSETDLIKDKNPFAKVILASLYRIKSKRNIN